MKKTNSKSEKLDILVNRLIILKDDKKQIDSEIKELTEKIKNIVPIDTQVKTLSGCTATHSEKMNRLFSNEAKTNLLEKHLTLEQFIDSVNISLSNLKNYLSDTLVTVLADRVNYTYSVTTKK